MKNYPTRLFESEYRVGLNDRLRFLLKMSEGERSFPGSESPRGPLRFPERTTLGPSACVDPRVTPEARRQAGCSGRCRAVLDEDEARDTVKDN